MVIKMATMWQKMAIKMEIKIDEKMAIKWKKRR